MQHDTTLRRVRGALCLKMAWLIRARGSVNLMRCKSSGQLMTSALQGRPRRHLLPHLGLPDRAPPQAPLQCMDGMQYWMEMQGVRRTNVSPASGMCHPGGCCADELKDLRLGWHQYACLGAGQLHNAAWTVPRVLQLRRLAVRGWGDRRSPGRNLAKLVECRVLGQAAGPAHLPVLACHLVDPVLTWTFPCTQEPVPLLCN